MSSFPSFHDFNVATRDVRVVDDKMIHNEATKNTYLMGRLLDGLDLKKQIRGGKRLVDHIDTGTGNTYGPYSPGQEENPTGTDSLKEIAVLWSFNRAWYTYDEEEEDANDGDPARYINLKKAYEARCLVDVLNGQENQLLALPNYERMELGQKPRQPYSLLALVTRDGEVPSSTNGGVASGSSDWSTLMTLNPTVEDYWKNKFDTYDASALDDPDDGLVTKFGKVIRSAQFEMPTALRRYSNAQDDTKSMRKQLIITSNDGIAVYEARMRGLNDRMRVINDPHIAGPQYMGIPIDYVSTLDDLGWTTGQPDYIGFNFNYMYPCFHAKWFLTQKITDGGSRQPNRHVAWKFITWNLFMNSRRRQWRLSAA